METFADKVRNGHMARFDPMLEERGGWVAGEGPKVDAVMSDDVIEVLATRSQEIYSIPLRNKLVRSSQQTLRGTLVGS